MLKYCLGVGAGIVIGRISRSGDSIGRVGVAGPKFLQDYYHPSNDNGWHDISVYFGDRNSIKEEAKSQEGQDDIISNLMSLYRRISSSKKKKGTIRNTTTEAEVPDQMYFVDLAANDPIDLSNTFKLEQMGWEGLCIEPNPVYWYRLSIVNVLSRVHLWAAKPICSRWTYHCPTRYEEVLSGIILTRKKSTSRRKKSVLR